ncbi:citrate transporter [Haliscomenobacter hydrossis]|uniref:Citrate transporter n=1 Tax=Haliscomenobacter hydrossis (strain ATCC 27775 / DSM 1100 / LMG 10767 / O) TaxID=760192 RepID=F4L7A1_HALH1|nr:citrate transporter [Haliscomenobacter hydrossis]AEE53128.1 Citrate transporter [Haliscomenobacter hydrossis DSM 1100]
MIALGLLGIFILFAALMFTRKVPALLALPCMAILIAVLAQLPFTEVLNHIVAQGSVKLAPVYVAVFAGAMMGRVMMQTGIAEEIIKRAAEFGGERPLVVAFGLMLVTVVLFTTLQGLGAIITVGSLVLPIMMSLGIPRKLAGTLFLLAFGTGFIFNPILFTLYRQLLQLDETAMLPPQVSSFALILLGLMLVTMVIYALIAAKRSGEMLLMAAESTNDLLQRKSASKVPFLALFSPVLPLLLFFGFNYFGLKLDFIAAFIIGSLFAVWTTDWRNSIKTLSASAIKGIEDGAPAALLMMGIGMLLNALNLPAIKTALEPLIQALPFSSAVFYIAFFGLLSPLALYRGPLNVFGIGIGLFSIMFGAQILPAMALLAAIMCVVQVQNICDPTNTHNVWIANFVGVRVEQFTKDTIGPVMLVCIIGLIIAASFYM